ncbi:DgyrCDS2393 [Dimorphilus gyrociliatus]|uniref:DgyrCDS2393 n=1 Tax=Dimorphilus gyrociliatus TaxID=2664684 RepID=A0A7I8VBH0_9ANNE|nr:DgyrCDS2393 [Dimorphilus gyrociliatus]
MLKQDIRTYGVCIGVITGSITLGVYAYKRLFSRLPPGPFTIPFFGSPARKNELVYETNKRLAEKYGVIFSYWSGTQLKIFLNDYNLIKEAFVNRGDEFSQAPPENMSYFLKFHDRFITVDYNEDVRILKRGILQAFRGLFGSGKTLLEDRIRFELFHKFYNIKDDTPIDVGEFFKALSVNVTCSMYFGKRFEYDSKEMDELFKLSQNYFKWFFVELTLNFTNMPLPFFLKKIIYRKAIQKSKDAIEGMRQWVRSMMEDHDDTEDDLVSAYKKLVPEAKIEEIIDTIMFLLSDPLDVVPGVLSGLFHLVAMHPEKQQKMFEEISNSQSSFLDQSKLPYVRAFIIETLRYANFVSNSAAHRVIKETTLQGYRIPKDADIYANFYAVHMNEETMKDCFIFRPERHLEDNHNIITFGIGRKSCLGEQWVRSQMYLTLVITLQKYRLEPTPGFNKLKYQSDVFHLPEKVELLFIDRNKSD